MDDNHFLVRLTSAVRWPNWLRDGCIGAYGPLCVAELDAVFGLCPIVLLPFPLR